jgi:hypothetical protein
VWELTADNYYSIAIATNLAEDSRPFVLRVFYDPSETFTQLYAKVHKVRNLYTSNPAYGHSLHSPRPNNSALTDFLDILDFQ